MLARWNCAARPIVRTDHARKNRPYFSITWNVASNFITRGMAQSTYAAKEIGADLNSADTI
jgi:hypothetical protein